MDTRQCRNCYVPFEPKRSDHFFCSGACVAAYYRSHPDPDLIHADLPHNKPHVCEQCGKPYHVNDYAERGGKRQPKYCSPKCKQAAYRARQQNPKEQAKRRYGEQWRQEKREKSQQREQPKQQTYHSKLDHALAVLSLPMAFTQPELKKAYRELAKKWHPDINKSPMAEQMMKDINWAYDYLKR